MTIGLIPCAGSATRIQGLPKWCLPIPDSYLLANLIHRIDKVTPSVIIGVNPENASIVTQYKQTGFVHTAKNFKTMSETVLSCRLFTDKQDVLFGMPDTFTEDDNVYPKLATALEDGADVAVALFLPRPEQHKKAGMCTINGNQVQEVLDKPVNKMHYTHLWGALAWKSAFWQHIRPEDPHVGYALPRAIAAGLDVRAVRCDGQYFDCGTYAEYEDLIVHLHGRKEKAEMAQIYG